MNHLPRFDETSPDIVRGFGLEESHDGGWYPYRVDETDSTQIHHITDEQGLDLRCASREETLAVLKQKVSEQCGKNTL